MSQCPAEDMWKKDIVKRFGRIFKNGRVLEIGSAIANNSGWFPAKEYIGLDVADSGGVNVVSIAHEYKAPDGSFDAVCSFSALEHDMYWEKTLRKMIRLIRSGGIMFFSCCRNWEEHGTKRTSPEQSLTTQISEEWANYYRNITPEDIEKTLKLDKIFSKYKLGFSQYHDGLTIFWGIKK